MTSKHLVTDLFSTPADISRLHKYWLGIDDIFENMRRVTKTAGLPHDIKKVSDDMYVFEIAVAGYKKDELKVEQLKDGIRVSGKHDEQEEVSYLYKGMMFRNFSMMFPITWNEGFKVGSVSLKDGILRIVVQIEKTPLGRMLDIKTDEDNE